MQNIMGHVHLYKVKVINKMYKCRYLQQFIELLATTKQENS